MHLRVAEACLKHQKNMVTTSYISPANSDLIHKMQWLGLFAHQKIAISKGTNADVLVDLMLSKMSYSAFEKDMVIVHANIVK